MASSEFARLPGFRDFPPEEYALRAHIQDAWRAAAGRYGFEEYDGPPLEPLDLYVEKSGEEIVGQLYNFTDKGEREVSLRPEMTPSLARILSGRSRGMSKPIRWFSVPQLFRYERQQRGRLREHFQWNVDIVGEESVAADAEVVAVAIDGLRALGLTEADFAVRVSDRKLLTALLGVIGVTPSRLTAAFSVIDKMERLPTESADGLFRTKAGLDDGQVQALRGLLDVTDVEALAEGFGGHPAVAPELDRLRDYMAHLQAMGLGDFIQVDLRIVRGLAYYTGIVFELFDRAGELRAICGGGRYDDLLERVGGEALPAVGFGMGDVVLGELLASRGLVPEYRRHVDFFVLWVTPAQRADAIRLAHELRDGGRSVAYSLKAASITKQLKAAAKHGADTAVILGPDEAERGVVLTRDMRTGEEAEKAPSSLL